MDFLILHRIRTLIIRLASQEELALCDALQTTTRNFPRGYDRIGKESGQ